MKNETHKTRGGALPPTRATIHHTPMARRPQRRGRSGGTVGRMRRSDGISAWSGSVIGSPKKKERFLPQESLDRTIEFKNNFLVQ
jgi:hypothetical protein